jgi:16S rRNA (uracil1498-N3)-methyltransferase
MSLFYQKEISSDFITLNFDNAKHAIQVLRKQINDPISITNGEGLLLNCTIVELTKKNCIVKVIDSNFHQATQKQIHLGIAFTKNIARIEWLLEKCTEIGIQHIWPLITERTEKHYFKKERLEKIISSAICQSQQYYLPYLHDSVSLTNLFEQQLPNQKYIAHCIPNQEKISLKSETSNANASLILIGPEGDFTKNEIDLCIQRGCLAVSLGNNRLRTETAGIVAVTLLNDL